MAKTGLLRLSLVGLFIVASLAAGLGLCAAMSNHNSDAESSHDAQELAELYAAMQNPYADYNPQSALDRAAALKAIKKLYGSIGPSSPDNWEYWVNVWLNAEKKCENHTNFFAISKKRVREGQY
ncbi:Uncharacterised protein [uncultured archaeon]|nr:Uncharacterised protein [uncultured archaeon]